MAKFEKGHPKIGGIEKGGKHAKTKAWDALGEYLINELAEEYMEWLKTLQPEDKARQFHLLIEYFRPKLQRAEVQQETTLTDLRRPQKHIFIGYTDDEELKIRREMDNKPIEPNELPGGVHIKYRDDDEATLPKIHINRDAED
jgi:hypothetical protein